MHYMMMSGEKEEEFVPLNWDALVKNPAVFEAIKEEMEDKFSAECLMKIITAAIAMMPATIAWPIAFPYPLIFLLLSSCLGDGD